MALGTHNIATWIGANVAGAPTSLELVDVLQNFGKSRATRLLIRRGKENRVHCELRMPLLRDCWMRSDELGRAVRKVWRAAIDGVEPDDWFVIDLHLGSDSRLLLQVAPTS